MAEGARLESVYTRKCIEGSNPSLTAIFERKALTKVRAFFFGTKFGVYTQNNSSCGKAAIEKQIGQEPI